MRYILTALTSLLLSVGLFIQSAIATESEAVDTGKVVAQLVSSHHSAPAGSTIQVALRTVLDDKWHTYWRNPGDSGEPVQIDWTLPEGVSAGDIIWPLPYAIPTGPIINYGFEGIPYFPVDITLPADAQNGEMILIEAGVYYLVCKDVCIPESTDLSLQILIGEAELNGRWESAISRAVADAPKLGSVNAGVVKTDANVDFTFSNLPEGDYSEAFFFPNDLGVIAPSAPQVLRQGSNGVSISVPAEYLWDQTLPEMFEGVLSYSEGGETKGVIVQAKVGETVDIGATAGGASGTDIATGGVAGIGLWGAVIGAFIGGLILNLMPCVFPIISMKALSLTKAAHGEAKTVRREAHLYTLGVIATFALLSFILIGLKAAGAEIGWGFQLQSPIVVGVLSLLLFAIGLNLLGLFEFGAGLQNTGSGLIARGGNSGAFFTGALAVIVATPCTAPFMAGAIGYAMAQSAGVMFAVFMALAIGFALPFLLLGYAPSLLAKLPKPGPWMVRFKEFLAFPMLAAAVWLVWVLSLQAGADGVLKILLAMLLLGFAIWWAKRRGGVSRTLAILSFLAALALPFTLSVDSSASGVSLSSEGYEKLAWSPEMVKERRAAGQPVFVDFTAAWCVTCKVNERVVLERDSVKQIFKDSNTAFLVADWTNKNDEIARELASHGRSGVPLYLVYPSGHNDVRPTILPQVLTESVLREALLGE
jgi:thiol:disulfide interchange protein DsbD